VRFFEPSERGAQVCLVEQLAAVDQVALEYQNGGCPPFSFEAVLRGPVRREGDNRSLVA
jgi:hypothetical protein